MHSLNLIVTICAITTQFGYGLTVVQHLIPVIDTPTLAQLGIAHSKFHQSLNRELCERAPDTLQHIVDYSSAIINIYDLSHSYLMHQNVSQLSLYLKLFVIDRSMDFMFLLRMRTMYSIDTDVVQTVDSKYNLSLKANKVREWMNANNCTETLLSQRFKDIINNKWKYTRTLSEWVGVNKALIDYPLLHSLWHDMRFVIKKYILKMVMNRTSSIHSLFFSDYNWLQLLNIIANTEQIPRESISVLMKKLQTFEAAAMDLFKEITAEYGYYDIMDINTSINPLSFTDISGITTDVFEKIMHSVTHYKIDDGIGLINAEYENCAVHLVSLRIAVLRHIGMNETEQKEVHKILNELDKFTFQVISLLYNAQK